MQTGRDANGITSLNRHALEQIIAASSAGILVADAQNSRLPIVYVNPAYEALTGYSAAELAGHPWALLARVASGDAELEHLRSAVGRGEPCRVAITDLRKDGTAFACQITVTPLHNSQGELKYFLCLQHPAEMVPERRAPAAVAAAEIAVLAKGQDRPKPKVGVSDRLDPATGLLRFEFFQETLQRDLAVARRERRFVTLLALAIVEFDVYRQTFGEKAADSCQRMIAAQIARTLRRAGDLCARFDDSTLVAAVLGQEPAEIQPLADQIAENVRQLGLHNPRGKTSRYITVRAVVIGCPPGEAHEDPAIAIANALSGARGDDPQLRAVQA